MADKKQDKAEGAAAAADGDAPDNDPMAGAGAPDGESAAESTDEARPATSMPPPHWTPATPTLSRRLSPSATR